MKSVAGRPLSPIDVRLRVLDAALGPAVEIARALGLSLDDVQQLLSIAYFRTLQQRGQSWEQIARKLGKSRRTVATLAKAASSEGPPLGDSQRVQWRRRLVRALATRGPSAVKRLVRGFPDATTDDLTRELEQLESQGVVVREDEQWSVCAEELDLVTEDVEHRIDSLRHLLGAVTQVIVQRFLAAQQVRESRESFARVLTFSSARAELATIRDATFASLRTRVGDADASAEADPEAVQASAVFCLVETDRAHARSDAT